MTKRKKKKSKQPEARISPGGNPPVGNRPVTGQSLVTALRASPHRDIDIESERIQMPVRDVDR
jgi:hypothetical protein